MINPSTTTNTPAKPQESIPVHQPIASAGEAPNTDFENDEFFKELTAGMQGLMAEFGGLSGEDKDAFNSVFESIRKEPLAGPIPSSTSSKRSQLKESTEPGNFQDRIKETMSKLQESSEQSQVCLLFPMLLCVFMALIKYFFQRLE
jgi:hypothetical protein